MTTWIYLMLVKIWFFCSLISVRRLILLTTRACFRVCNNFVWSSGTALYKFITLLSCWGKHVLINKPSSSNSTVGIGIPQSTLLCPYLITINIPPLDNIILKFKVSFHYVRSLHPKLLPPPQPPSPPPHMATETRVNDLCSNDQYFGRPILDVKHYG